MSSILQQVSDGFAAAVADASPAVVRVEGRRRMPATGIVWSADGVIMTAHHVVARDEGVRVGLADGRTVPAALVGRDPTTDLAVLRAEASDLQPPAWADAGTAQVGQLVLAVGRPGESVQAALGVINTVGEAWRTHAGGHIDRYIQTDLTMYPGFSGGPLLGAAGDVVGMNVSALLRGVSLTIPAVTLRRVAEALLAHGHVRRGYLGISAQPVRLPDAIVAGLEQETGLLLMGVESGSPAEEAGLLLGDAIVGAEGEPVRHMDDLQAFLTGDRVGSAITLRVVRGGKLQELPVTVGERG